jgi:putative hydrolase of the HAD superfamily
LSDLAEYARKLHESEVREFQREILPVRYPSKLEELTDIRAVICDVYGTLVNYWRPAFTGSDGKISSLLEAFRLVIERFGMTPYLVEMNPDETPEKTLSDLYHGLIALNHEKALKKGLTFPEIRIEEVWNLILMMIKRRGYEPELYCPGAGNDLPKYIAFTYNFFALGRGLYDGVTTALEEFRKNNITVGILSNAQFYTPVDLTLMVRDQSRGAYDDYQELFDPDLIFYSYEYGVGKPNQLLFRKLYDVLYEKHILPSQTVFVGNDLAIDIQPAEEAGMKTAFFTGDKEAAFVHDLDGKVIPDITFENWSDLPRSVSFYSGGNSPL